MRATKRLASSPARIEVIDRTLPAPRPLEIVRDPDAQARTARELAIPASSGIMVVDFTAIEATSVCHYCQREERAPVHCARCKRSLCAPCQRGLCGSGQCAPRPQGDGVR
jgi:hypothetical protein